MSRCRLYQQKPNINHDISLSAIPINCGNCDLWGGERCSDEKGAIAIGLLAEFGW